MVEQKRTDPRKLERPKSPQNRDGRRENERLEKNYERTDPRKMERAEEDEKTNPLKMERAEEDEKNVNLDEKPGSDTKSGLIEPLIYRKPKRGN